MKISIIIPTHNRADQLKNVIESIVHLKQEAEFEIVVVDNNSTDNTKEVVESYSDFARYVFEKRTSFTRARNTGEENATGDILLYLDDDVIVNLGSLKKIVEVFTLHPDCGVIAGKILPKFIGTPPQWTLDCQKSFDGWSLYNPEQMHNLREDFQEVTWAAGPMMAVRRSVYKMVGGFPPDTIGVETNKGPKSFNKLYIGPGDCGLCSMIRDAGFKVYYSSDISVYHIIPPIRFTIGFWRSRLIGEGYYTAIAQRAFFKLSKIETLIKFLDYQAHYYQFEKRLLSKLNSFKNRNSKLLSFEGMFPEELWVLYYKAYLDMDWVLRKYPDLWHFLWKIGYEGVSSDEFDHVINRLPVEYKNLVSNELVYEASPLNSISSYEKLIKNKGYYNKNLNLLFRIYIPIISPIIKLWRILNYIHHKFLSALYKFRRRKKPYINTKNQIKEN